MNPIFTVIIPTYNHAEFLIHALRSVLNQTFLSWECLIVDNHSNDNTEEIVKEFNDPRFKLIKIHNHGVIAASRNLGIENSKGEWIAFLDSDDLWYATKLEVVASEIFANKELDVVCTNEWLIQKESSIKTLLRYGPYCKEFYQALLIDGNRLSTSATVIKKNFLNKSLLRFREDKNYIAVEDYDLWLRLANCGAKFSFLNSIQGEYLIHAGNTSTNTVRYHQNLKKMLYDHVFNIQTFSSDYVRIWRRVLARVMLSEAKASFIHKEFRVGINLIFHALIISPLSIIKYFFTRLFRHGIF